MLTLEQIKKATGLYNIPKSIHVNHGVVLDHRLIQALTNEDPRENDYKYDFDIYLPTYGINLQRPYVWKPVQQRAYILSIIQDRSLEPLVVVTHEHKINYVIDGKQRLLTIKRFVENKFPITIDGVDYYYKDFDRDAKLRFNTNVDYISAHVYYSYDNDPVTEDMMITLFNFYNFSGTPQTEAHKQKLLNLLKK